MAKKHRDYKPQIRKPRVVAPAVHHEQISSSEQLSPEQAIEQTRNKIADLFEVDRVAAGEQTSTALGALMTSSASILKFHSPEKELTRDDLLAMLPDFVVEMRGAVDELAKDGIDVANEHYAISPNRGLTLAAKAIKSFGIDFDDDFDDSKFSDVVLENIKQFQLDTGSMHLDESNPEAEATHQGLQTAFYIRLLQTYMLNRRTANLMRNKEYGDDLLNSYFVQAMAGVNGRVGQNPNSVRRETTNVLGYLMGREVSEFLDHYGHNTGRSIEPVLVENLPTHMQLDFSVLPAGTDLEKFAYEIVEGLSDTERARVDLGRLGVLESIRRLWGVDQSFYAHGKKSGRQMFDLETNTMIDEDYIVLVMQELDSNRTIIGEHALAISPIARKHAAYLTRYDVNNVSWRDVFSQNKAQARQVGARDLRFTASENHTAYNMMTEKVSTLLLCEPEEFGGRLRMYEDGSYRVNNYQRNLGKTALSLGQKNADQLY